MSFHRLNRPTFCLIDLINRTTSRDRLTDPFQIQTSPDKIVGIMILNMIVHAFEQKEQIKISYLVFWNNYKN